MTQLGKCTRCSSWGPIAFRNRFNLLLCPTCLEKWLKRTPPPASFPRTVSFTSGASVTLTGDVREGDSIVVRGQAYRVAVPPEVHEHVASLRRGRPA